MADKRRLSIDLTELIEMIESYRTDNAWKELTITQKVRTMIRDAFDKRDA